MFKEELLAIELVEDYRLALKERKPAEAEQILRQLNDQHRITIKFHDGILRWLLEYYLPHDLDEAERVAHSTRCEVTRANRIAFITGLRAAV